MTNSHTITMPARVEFVEGPSYDGNSKELVVFLNGDMYDGLSVPMGEEETVLDLIKEHGTEWGSHTPQDWWI